MKPQQRYKVAFISSRNIADQNSLSGTAYYMSKAFKKHIGDVDFIEPLLPPKKSVFYLFTHFDILKVVIWQMVIQLIYKLRGKRYQWERTIPVSLAYAKRLKRLLEGKDYDFILADKGSIVIAFSNTDIPILYCCDTTFSLMVDYYPSHSNLCEETKKQGHQLEKMAIDKAHAIIYRSLWAAKSAINDYGADPQKLSVALFGPNLDEKYIPSQINHVKMPHQSPCNLLLVGRQWFRKGCDTAIRATGLLRDAGIDAKLTICGAKNPDKNVLPDYVKLVPLLDKGITEDAEKLVHLYKQASFFLMPSRAEAFGIVGLEACAFGIPIIASNTGGIPDVIHNGLNGILIDRFEDASEFASAVKDIYYDIERYKKYCLGARNFYEEHANWNCWAKKVKKIMEGKVPAETSQQV